ncbi:MAG: PorV/PorQ family protein [Candidatus Marinimicrobia bacterium]|nr:PorV/PorQ family protein [Candidatus Neomarinimicrobiota bacterium]
MKKYIRKMFSIALILIFMIFTSAYSQIPSRVGTTAANFLEYGFGSAGSAMGDAYVSMANDLSSIYWNPAGLGFMNQSEAMFMYQPWIVDISTSFTAVGIVLPTVGTIAFGLISVNYGEMDVTTLLMQEGTGETFSPSDLAFSISYARRLTTWFSFGASVKHISSNILHCNASAFAVDFGVLINTHFFSPTGQRENGLKLGMSISNYGTRMKYGGMDLINPIDILPDQQGNFRDVPGQFRTGEWELPLIFRFGISVNPVYTRTNQVTLSVDALHPNNNFESVNAGMQYTIVLPSFGKIFLRGGYKALFMTDSQYGLSMGGGVIICFFGNRNIKLDYAYRDIGILGGTHAYSISFLF